MEPISGETTAAQDGDDILVSGDVNLSGGLALFSGTLSADHQLTVSQDLTLHDSLLLSNQLGLKRSDGLTDVLLSLSDTELGLNVDLTQGEGEHVYDIIRFKGDVLFHDRVDLDEAYLDTDPECVITPARIKASDCADPDNPDEDSDCQFEGCLLYTSPSPRD